jgi:hypothetical protein
MTMGAPKDHVVAARPKKGNACYLCGRALDTDPAIQIQVQMPLVKFKSIVQRGCIPCAEELRALLDLRITQAKAGEYQA